MKYLGIYFLSLFLPLFCFAQDVGVEAEGPKTTVLNFEDELIEGDVTSPDLLFILKSKNANYGRLLKLRDNFIPEMQKTRHDVLRGNQ